MGSKRKRRALTRDTQSAPLTLHTLISSIQSLQGLNPENLKKLYTMLLHLSLKKSTLSCSNYGSGDMELDKCGVRLKFKDFYDLSDVLFKELDRRFKQVFSALNYISVSGNSAKSTLIMNIWAKRDELMLLLRCCMVMLVLIAFNQNLIIDKGKVLHSILGRLISYGLSGGAGGSDKTSTFKRFISVETASLTAESAVSKCSLQPSDWFYTLMCAALEVFADELLMHKSLMEYFILIDSASLRSEMLFKFHFGHDNIGSVLEVVCAHFILSISNEQAFVNFLNRLFWCHEKDFQIPEISLPAALALLLNPVLNSAPKIFQAYLILLVSETIGICTASENMILDVQLLDWYSTAFERSALLYARHISSLLADSHHSDSDGSFVKSNLHGSNPLNFESFLLQATVEKLYHSISKSESLWASYLSKMFCRTKSDLVASSIAYVKDNMSIFDESYKDEILSILFCIILGCSSDDICSTLFQNGEEISPKDIYLLASILKLMSSSMLQTIWYVRHIQFSGCLKSSGNLSSCKEYNSMVHILGYFRRYTIHLPMQKLLHEILQSHPARHKESKWMLLHLLGLLSLSYVNGIDFLVKGCLFTLMTLLSLYVVEDGDLSALRSLCGSRSKSYSSKLSDNVERVLVVRKSSQLIYSEFQKIQDRYLRTRSDESKQVKRAETSEYSTFLNDLDSAVTTATCTEETCKGDAFLKSILGRKYKTSDFDDLSDFIVCEPGKDYSVWLKDREKFRQWKHKKMINFRRKKRKMAWKSMK